MEGVGIADTNEIVTYDAISYVWGHTALDAQIVCNNIARPTCTSLAVAVKKLVQVNAQKVLLVRCNLH